MKIAALFVALLPALATPTPSIHDSMRAGKGFAVFFPIENYAYWGKLTGPIQEADAQRLVFLDDEAAAATPESYTDFAARFPAGPYAAVAQRRDATTPTTSPAWDDPKAGEVWDTSSNMVLVKGGTFTMGCQDGSDKECDNDERPAHQVTLKDFYLGKYEVTVAEFKAFIDAAAYQTDAEKEGWSYAWVGSTWEKKHGVTWKCDAQGQVRPSDDYNHPVIHVSWNDAKAYCEWLSKQGRAYRLPTEAEWEYAAGGGVSTAGYAYAGGNTLTEVAWYSDNSEKKTHPVGGKKANELGLYDMSGNVCEWCSDWKAPYPSAAQTNPTGPTSGLYRVLRGGSWVNLPRHCRAANRNSGGPTIRDINIGFRVAASFPAQ